MAQSAAQGCTRPHGYFPLQGAAWQGLEDYRDGIGALIHVSASTGEQWNRVATSVGYGGSSDRIAHFGLAGALEVKQVDIEWPSGVRQTLRGLAADRYVTIDEP